MFGPLDAFVVRLNITGYGGLVLASPVILFELWRFVTPGLKANEKRYAIPFALSTVALFLFGAFIAWLTFPHALGFLHAVGGSNINDLFTPSKYLGLIIALMTIFGASFEFPVVLVALEIAGVLTPAEARPLASPRHRHHRHLRRRRDPELGPVLHARDGGPDAPLLRGVDPSRQARHPQTPTRDEHLTP